MDENDKKNLALLNSIMQKYCPTEKDCEAIEKKCPKVLMSTSRRVSGWGMLLPNLDLQNYFWVFYGEKGRLVKNPAKCDFTYYYDENDRLLLTKRKYAESELGLIYYYHYDNYIDMFWYTPERNYSIKEKNISAVGRIEMSDGVLSRFIYSELSCVTSVEDYIEHLFSKKTNKVTVHSYYSADGFLEESSSYKIRDFEMGKII